MEGALDIVDGLDAGVEVLDEEGQTDTHHQADDNAQGDVQRFVGTHRFRSGLRTIDNRDHDSLGQGFVHALRFDLVFQDGAEPDEILELALGIEIGLASSLASFMSSNLAASTCWLRLVSALPKASTLTVKVSMMPWTRFSILS